MIKNSAIRRICIATLALFILLIIYLFPTNDYEIRTHISYNKKDEMPIFLLDKDNFVARSTIVKDSVEKIQMIKDIIESLTKDTKKSSYIKDGFSAIIPINTKLLDVSIKEDIVILNFSKELLNVSISEEEKMIEAITYSILEIEDIKKISIMVDGNALTKLPNSNKKIPQYLDKNYGINKIYNIDNIKDTSKTTIYYLSKINDYYYYVPVTKISNDTLERVEVIIKELKSTPIYHTNLISYLQASASISNYELLEDSINLSFNNYLIANMKDEDILEEVKYSIALSIRDTYGINEVLFNIPNIEDSIIKT